MYNCAMKLSVELLDQCSNTLEVQTLLGENSGLVTVMGCRGSRREQRVLNMKVSRLVAALEMHQKEFVGHMCCQQILRKEWYGGIKWQKQSFLQKVAQIKIKFSFC